MQTRNLRLTLHTALHFSKRGNIVLGPLAQFRVTKSAPSLSRRTRDSGIGTPSNVMSFLLKGQMLTTAGKSGR